MERHSSHGSESLWLSALKIAAVSVLLNVIIFYIGKAFGSMHSYLPVPSERQLTLIPVIVVSALAAFIGAGAYALLRLFVSRPYKVFSILAVIVLIVSFAAPYIVPGVNHDMAFTLDAMHIVVVAAMLFFLRRHRG